MIQWPFSLHWTQEMDCSSNIKLLKNKKQVWQAYNSVINTLHLSVKVYYSIFFIEARFHRACFSFYDLFILTWLCMQVFIASGWLTCRAPLVFSDRLKCDVWSQSWIKSLKTYLDDTVTRTGSHTHIQLLDVTTLPPPFLSVCLIFPSSFSSFNYQRCCSSRLPLANTTNIAINSSRKRSAAAFVVLRAAKRPTFLRCSTEYYICDAAF